MMILIVLFLGALIALAVWGIAWLFPSSHTLAKRTGPRQDAMASLTLRYARGEIARDTYLTMKRNLRADSE